MKELGEQFALKTKRRKLKMDFKTISALAIEANGKRGHVVNCWYSGHVNIIDLSISESKDKYNNKLYECSFIREKETERLEEVANILQRMIDGEEVFKPISKVTIPEHTETKWELAL